MGQCDLPLRRVFVTADQNVKAVYEDNSVLLLDSSGSTFTSVDPHGSRTTQLTLFALKRYHHKLTEVISFRNLHVEPPLVIPLLCLSTHSLGYAVTTVSWSATFAEAAADGLLRSEDDGSLTLDSHDHAARVVLHANRHRLAVCYPLLVSTRRGQHSKNDYIWQTQLFAVWECPECWRHPLSVLQIAAHSINCSQQAPLQQELVLLSEPLAAHCTSQLPAAQFPDTSLIAFPKQSWWQDCSDRPPNDIAIKLEWTPEALYQFSPCTNEVAVWIHADESCVQSEQEGRFFRHASGHLRQERLYAAEAVPSHTTTGSARLPLASFANHATAIRCAPKLPWRQVSLARLPQSLQPSLVCTKRFCEERTYLCDLPDASDGVSGAVVHACTLQLCTDGSCNCRQLGSRGTGSTSSEQCSQEQNWKQDNMVQLAEAMQLCQQIHEQHTVEGVGTFTAFQDGSVKVAFEDRALLYMHPTGAHCTLINPEGSKVAVACANPLGAEKYVAEAVKFAAWAFCSPVERSAMLQQAASVKRELYKCQRTALLCDWAQGCAVEQCTDAEGSHVVEPDTLSHEHTSRSSEWCKAAPQWNDCCHSQLDPDQRQHLIERCLANSTRLLSTLSC